MRRSTRLLLFGGSSFIGDLLSVRARACYGLRRLYSDYSGALITVRRSSDNALRDIRATSNGDLDTVDLLSFVGGNNGFIQTMYDQSGNGYHQINNTNASQPQIVVSGAVNVEGSRPALLLSGSQFLSTANWSTSNMFGGVAATMNIVAKSTSTNDQDFFSWGGAAALTLRSLGGTTNTWRSTTSGDINNATVTLQTFATVTNTWDGTTSTLFTQGVSRGASTGAENTNVTELFIGQRSTLGTRAVGNFCEGWILPAAMPANDLAILHRDQGAYYGITVS